MQNLNTLSTPEDFINHYYNELKSELNSANIQISKVGVFGYFLHILGNLQYDVKQYYDNLFNEAFPISSIDNANLVQHASLFGFTHDLAVAAQLNGSFHFNLNGLITNPNIYKREIIISGVSAIIGDMKYILNSEYILSMIKNNLGVNNWFVTVIKQNSEKIINPINYSNAEAAIYDFYQYNTIDNEYAIPLYKYGSFYTIKIPIPSGEDVANISVRVKEITNDFEEDFQVKNIKNFSDGNSTHIFYRVYETESGRTLLIELGSGYQGKYIPKSKVTISIKTTFGEKGNIGKYSRNETNFKFEGTVNVIDYTPEGQSLINQFIDINNLLKIDITHGSGGINTLKEDELRAALIDYIQNRKNLVSETDYSQIIAKLFKYQSILFKKTTMHENIIYIYIDLLDKYSNPIYTDTKCIPYIDFVGVNESNLVKYLINDTESDDYLLNPEYTIGDEQFICPFIFKRRRLLNSFDAYLYKENYFQYYTSIIENSSAFQNTTYSKILPLIYISIDIKIANNPLTNKVDVKTIIYIKSTDHIDFYTIKVTIPELNILNQTSTQFEDSLITKVYEIDGLYSDPLTITLNIYDRLEYIDSNGNIVIPDPDNDGSGTNIYDLKFEQVHYIIDLQDILRLKRFIFQSIDYITSVPLIHKSQYLNNKEYINNQLFTSLSSTEISNLRLITDDPQIRFLNSYLITSQYLTQICSLNSSLNEYNFDLYLPLKANIDIAFNKSYMQLNKISVLDEIDTIKTEIAKMLNSKRTGTNLYFYKSMIADIIHNFKSVQGANISITDSKGTLIPNGNLIIRNPEDLVQILDKLQFLLYCPALFWWDLNNINTTYALV